MAKFLHTTRTTSSTQTFESERGWSVVTSCTSEHAYGRNAAEAVEYIVEKDYRHAVRYAYKGEVVTRGSAREVEPGVFEFTNHRGSSWLVIAVY